MNLLLCTSICDRFINFEFSVSAGEYMVVNRHLVKELSDSGLWSEDVRAMIIANKGSIQTINTIPASVRSVFKTAWEIPQKTILDMAAD